uniref:Uncharacterized protein n=1 Tax=Amphimedon queenslandica TaxID=400682 RepID=A0A1X7TYJ3_AMPQE
MLVLYNINQEVMGRCFKLIRQATNLAMSTISTTDLLNYGIALILVFHYQFRKQLASLYKKLLSNELDLAP